jgi:hypothetical protein
MGHEIRPKIGEKISPAVDKEKRKELTICSCCQQVLGSAAVVKTILVLLYIMLLRQSCLLYGQCWRPALTHTVTKFKRTYIQN